MNLQKMPSMALAALDEISTGRYYQEEMQPEER
jgi:hypothetical protein